MSKQWVLAILISLPLTCAAQTYKCTSGGRVTLTDTPCDSTKAIANEPKKTDSLENMTAAQIQAEFEKEVAERKEAENRHAIERQQLLSDNNNTPGVRESLPFIETIKPTEPSSSGAGGLILMLLGIYFLPAIIAAGRSHHNATAIFLLDLLLGWTAIGWILSLVWAATAVQQKTKQPNPQPE